MSATLRPFFSYYGGKWYSARQYPSPTMPHIIEPFAGSAGYSLRYPDRRVTLYDANEKVAGTWQYLIGASADEIRRLPTLGAGQSVDELNLCQEARWLIGWWLNKGASAPHKTMSAWGRDPAYADQFWGPRIKERVASQVDSIRHWRIICGTYEDADDEAATWFVDPPYSNAAGRRYPRHELDYAELGQWVRTRRGQVIACEQSGATWLPFVHLHAAKATSGSRRSSRYSAEAVWTNDAAEDHQKHLLKFGDLGYGA